MPCKAAPSGNLSRNASLPGEASTRGGGWRAAMYSIFYIIGVIVVVLAILSLLGLA